MGYRPEGMPILNQSWDLESLATNKCEVMKLFLYVTIEAFISHHHLNKTIGFLTRPASKFKMERRRVRARGDYALSHRLSK